MELLVKGRVRALLVLAVAVYFVLFSIYLKSSPPAPVNGGSPVVKIWVDPDRSFDRIVKVAPISILFFVLITSRLCSFRGTGVRKGFTEDPAPAVLFLKAPQWSRPPPVS